MIVMKNAFRNYLIIGVSSAISLFLHLYLTMQHYQLKFGHAKKSLCTLNSTFNCDAVSLSPFALFLGTPLSVWAMTTHGIFLCLVVIGLIGLVEDREKVNRYIFWLGSFILLCSLVMGTISLLFMKTYCLFCIGTYVFSFAIFWAALNLVGGLTPIKDSFSADLISLMKGSKWVAVMFLAIPATSMFFISIFKSHYGGDRLKYMISESINTWKTAPVQEFSPNGLVIEHGANSKVVVVEFADFLCPHCKNAVTAMHGFAESRKDVKFIFKVYPLDGACNDGIPESHNVLRCELAAAVYCAEKSAKKGWAAHDLIFERQEQLFSKNWKVFLPELAKSLGMAEAELDQCVQSDEMKKYVRELAAEGNRAKVQGTPAVFFNGKKLDAGSLFDVLATAYNSL